MSGETKTDGGGKADIKAILEAVDAASSIDVTENPTTNKYAHPRRKTLVVQAQRKVDPGVAKVPLDVKREPSRTPQICAVFRRTGKCPFGTKCPYIHDLSTSTQTTPKKAQKKPASHSRRSPKVHAEHHAVSADELRSQADAMADMNRQFELTSLNNALDNTLSDVSNLLENKGAHSPSGSSISPNLGSIQEDSRRTSFPHEHHRSPHQRNGATGNGHQLDQSFNFSQNHPSPTRASASPSLQSSRGLSSPKTRRHFSKKGRATAATKESVLHCGYTDQEVLAMVIKNQRAPLEKVFGWTKGRLSPDSNHLWSQGDAALHYAACYNSDMVAELLLEMSANPNTRNTQQQTPAHFAAQYDSAAVLDQLLSAKCSVHSRNLIEQTPLHYAARYSSVTALALLLDSKGDPNVPNSSGQTPMHYAFKHNRTHIASLLLDAGGTETMEKLNKKQQTPIELGRSGKSRETIAMYDEYKRSGFLPVTVEAALMRFRRKQDPQAHNDDLDHAHSEIARLTKELSESQQAKEVHENTIEELQERIASMRAEMHSLRQQVDDDLEVHFDGWQCFMCCLPKDLKVIPHGQLRTVKISRHK